MPDDSIVFIEASRARQLLTYRAAADIARGTYLALARGEVGVPEPRQAGLLLSAVQLDPPLTCHVVTKPAMVAGHVGVRLIVGGAAGAGFPDWRWTIIRRLEGGPITIVDERLVYVVRTAASLAIAASLLGPDRPWRLGLLGAGNVNRHVPHVLAELGVLVAEAVVASRTEAAAAALAAGFAHDLPGTRWATAATPHDLLARCDVVVVATTANAALIQRAEVRPGSLICAAGDSREVDDALLLAADPLVVDDWSLCASSVDMAPLVASGALPRSRAVLLQDVVAGRAVTRAGRSPAPVVHRSRGLAALDIMYAVAIAELHLRSAV